MMKGGLTAGHLVDWTGYLERIEREARLLPSITNNRHVESLLCSLVLTTTAHYDCRDTHHADDAQCNAKPG